MKIIIGLGNPGKKYEGTRHNIGFHAVDHLATLHKIAINKLKFKALYGEGNIGGEKVMIVKPQTFMNLSGDSVRDILAFYKLTPADILIIYDDISLDTGKIRVRQKGSAGGHNGIKSILLNVNTDVFDRIKIGVGSPNHAEHALVDFVLGHFDKTEYPMMDDAIKLTAQAVECLIKEGIETAMNQYNGNATKKGE